MLHFSGSWWRARTKELGCIGRNTRKRNFTWRERKTLSRWRLSKVTEQDVWEVAPIEGRDCGSRGESHAWDLTLDQETWHTWSSSLPQGQGCTRKCERRQSLAFLPCQAAERVVWCRRKWLDEWKLMIGAFTPLPGDREFMESLKQEKKNTHFPFPAVWHLCQFRCKAGSKKGQFWEAALRWNCTGFILT